MNDKRSFPRSVVDLIAHVNVEGKQIGCKIIDITVECISLELDQNLEAGTRVVVDIDECEEIKKCKLEAEIVRCVTKEDDPSKFTLIARFIEPSDCFLMDALALVHGSGPKRDRRGATYGKR